jgi:two-component system, OmpR family, sensor kinase
VALEVPLGISLRDRVDAEVRSQADSQADVLAATASDSVIPPRRAVLEPLMDRAARAARGRALAVDRRGRVIADSGGSGSQGADYSGRPEIARALAGETDQRERHSDTLDEDILATAVPVVHQGRTVGAVRITQSVAAVDRAVRRSTVGLVAIGALVLLAGLGAALFIAAQFAGPVRRLEAAAERVAAGELDARADVEGSAEQRSLARAFNEMTERLGRLLRSQAEFVADASHQLRTPLTGLRLRIEEAQAARGPEDAAIELKAATRELERLSQTIDELLLLSRAGERDVPGERVELGTAAAAAVERWAAASAQKQIDLVLSSEDAQDAFCARVDLDRALDVLIENALAYSPAGTVELVVHGTRIEILDRGPGLAAGEGEAVFERFHRGSAARDGPPGTGLGLPIARELMRPWHGSVALDNRDGGGARARIELPPFTEALPPVR